MDIQLGRLIQIPLREIWKHEALNYTQWLAQPDNLAVLSETIGIDLVDPQPEVSVGQFYVDIVAKDEHERTVVIENQLEATDHDHLGKLITYASGLGAEVVIWIVERAREEHEQAILWLNDNTTENANFFLVQMEAWVIGDSLPAPRFNIIAKPNDWAKVVKQSAAGGAITELKLSQQAFFEKVREYGAHHAPHIRSWRKPAPQNWYDISIGSSRAQISLWVRSGGIKQVTVQLYITDDKELFRDLVEQRDQIETELGGMQLDWLELPDRKASRIVINRSGDILDEAEADDLVVWAAETAEKFAQVFPKYL